MVNEINLNIILRKHLESFDTIIRIVSIIFDPRSVIICLLCNLIVYRDIIFLKISTCLILNSFIIYCIKIYINRPRPYTTGMISNKDLFKINDNMSFPSAHVANMYILAHILIGTDSLILPLLMTIVRMYLGVHYISDCVGGYLIGKLICFLL